MLTHGPATETGAMISMLVSERVYCEHSPGVRRTLPPGELVSPTSFIRSLSMSTVSPQMSE